jgi:phosphate transport system permease protein
MTIAELTTADHVPVAKVRPPRARPQGSGFEVVFEGLCFGAATALLIALGGILVSLLIGGWPALSKFGFGFLTNVTWDPVKDVYGAAGPIAGTLITSILALLFSLPIAGGVAFFLVELCPTFLRRPIGTAVELLAGIPSIVYGMWGLFVFAPFFAAKVETPLMSAAPPGSVRTGRAFWRPRSSWRS